MITYSKSEFSKQPDLGLGPLPAAWERVEESAVISCWPLNTCFIKRRGMHLLTQSSVNAICTPCDFSNSVWHVEVDNEILDIVSRILHFFPVLVSHLVTGVTSQVFLIT